MQAMRLVLCVFALIALVAVSSPVTGPVAHAMSHGPIDLGVHGHATAINDKDQVVGVDRSTGQSFLWEAGVVTALESGHGGSTPTDINGGGTVVGYSGDQTWPPTRQAVMWEGGQMVPLGTLGGAWSEATGINNRGQVAGTSETGGGDLRAFRWERGRMVALDVAGATDTEAADINLRGDVTGTAWFDDPPHRRAVVWSPRGTRVLSYSTQFDTWETRGQAINDHGDALVHARADGAFPGGVVWHRSGAVSTLPQRGFAVVPADVSRDGSVVANESDEVTGTIAFRWQPGDGDWGTTLPGHDNAPFYPTTYASAINGNGTIAGSAWAVDPVDDALSEQRAVIWRGTEPASPPDGQQPPHAVRPLGR